MGAVHRSKSSYQQLIDRPDVREIQSIFQQWKALTSELRERLATLLGEEGEADQEQDIQTIHTKSG